MATATLRVILDDKGYDLLGALSNARVSDLTALLAATGRNPFAVTQGINVLDKLGKLPEDERDAALAGALGTQFIETISDLVFLARRVDGEKSATSKDQPIGYAESCDKVPFFELLNAFGAAVQASNAEPVEEVDPTMPPTGSVGGGSDLRAV